MIDKDDREPFFYFIKNGEIAHASTINEWTTEGCAQSQEKYPDYQMWAYRFGKWIRYVRFEGVFETKRLEIPDCLKLVLLLE